MAQHKIAVEFKNRHLTRPMLDMIVGAQLRAVPDATEIIVRCRSAAKTAYEAIDSYGIRITIVAREATPQDS
ncbi:hypothetical protein [Nostoc sp.]|uniref:hypothetical protein n=1 Tax=Nostoc sp. TaxID=1180 RepID=UPI002FF95D5A